MLGAQYDFRTLDILSDFRIIRIIYCISIWCILDNPNANRRVVINQFIEFMKRALEPWSVGGRSLWAYSWTQARNDTNGSGVKCLILRKATS